MAAACWRRPASGPLHYGRLLGDFQFGLVLILVAAVSALAIPFTWAFARAAWSEQTAKLAAWILALYPEALGLLSGTCDASGVSGVHGKSTTTALVGTVLKAWQFPATVLVGTEVPAFGGRSTLVQGDRYLVAETCEYRRHFLNFHPERIIITSVEPHYFAGYTGGRKSLFPGLAGYETVWANHKLSMESGSELLVLAGNPVHEDMVEAYRMVNRPVFSVQHHPEASPGPQDSHYLFKRFVGYMEKAKG